MLVLPEPMSLLRSVATLAALIVAVMLWTDDAEAQLEQKFGLDGGTARIAMLALAADTAPGVKNAPDHPAVPPPHAGGTLDGLFNRGGLVAGFAAGFLGAGFLGVLFGQGLLSGLGGVASYFGLIFQLALVVLLFRLIWMWWNGRNAPSFAGLSPRQQAEAYLRSRNELLPGVYPLPSIQDATGDNDATADAGATTALPNKSQG